MRRTDSCATARDFYTSGGRANRRLSRGAFRTLFREGSLSLTRPAARRLLPLLLLSVLIPGLAQGQEDPGAVKRRNNCRLAAQVIETGHPAPHREWAWQYIGFCDAEHRVGVYLAAMQQARTSTDLPFIRRALLPVTAFRDRMLFEKVLSIASDKAASVPVRVVAFMVLASTLDPMISPTYEGFVGGLDEYGMPSGGCSRRLAHPIEFAEGPNAIPSDYQAVIADVSERVARDVSETANVRSAAACV